jgi:hypothetical protein
MVLHSGGGEVGRYSPPPMSAPARRAITATTMSRVNGCRCTHPQGSERERYGRYIWTMSTLTIKELGGHVRLTLGEFARGEGTSLQDAADDLVCSILRLAMAFRASGFGVCSEFRVDLETMNFLHELGEIAAAGGDIRARVFA